MSLVTEDERATLEAALAFIDTYEDASASLSASLSASVSTSTSSSSPSAGSRTAGSSGSEDGGERLVGAAQRRKARNAQASARSHRKKRAELLLLREQHELLRTQLDALRARRAARERREAAGDSDGSELGDAPAGRGEMVAVASAHLDKAMHERRLRQRAEALNRQLRAALAKQRSMTMHFSQLLQKRMPVQDIADVLSAGDSQWTPFSMPTYAPLPVAASRISQEKASILVELEGRMESLILEVDLALASEESEATTSSTQIKHHPQLGAFVEVSSASPLACSVEDAWTLFGDSLCSMKAHHASTYTFQTRPISDVAAEKEYSLAFEDKARLGVVPIDGVTFLQKFKTSSYATYIWTSVIRPRRDGVQFRESGWIAMSRSPSDPEKRCMYRQHYQLFAEPTRVQPSDQSAPDAVAYMKSFLLNSLASKMRNDQRHLEDILLKKFGDTLPLVPAM